MTKIMQIGDRFGCLEVVGESFARAASREKIWVAQCGCGSTHLMTATRLRRHPDRVCRHRQAVKHQLYKVWWKMCRRPEGVCATWKRDFWLFVKDMGPRPSPEHVLTRLDLTARFGPGNCRWGTWQQQARARKRTRWVMWRGKRTLLVDLPRPPGLDYYTLHARVVRLGWDLERAMQAPPRRYGTKSRRKAA